jgi:hypothetical protein
MEESKEILIDDGKERKRTKTSESIRNSWKPWVSCGPLT